MNTRNEYKGIAAELAAHVIKEMDELKMRPGNGTSMSPKRPTPGEMEGLLEHAIEKLSATYNVPTSFERRTPAAAPVPEPEQKKASVYTDGLCAIPAAVYMIDDKRKADLRHRFNYHAPKGDQAIRYSEIRTRVLELALYIAERAPESRELSTALTHLDAVMFNANAAIARNEGTR